jgi:rRNA maturation RNase YbeY
MAVNFFEEDIKYTLKNKTILKKWIRSSIQNEGYILNTINFIFCSDQYLHKINSEYLQHDTYTDIITFDTSAESDEISGDIFISIERVKDNATKFEVPVYDELCRVLIHGALHLCGYTDKKKKDKEVMRATEDKYLKSRNNYGK